MSIRDWFTYISVMGSRARREEGQTMAEYAVVLTVIAVGILLALGTLAAAISGRLDNVANTIKGAA